MKKCLKLVLNILTWGPLAWTILILIAARFCYGYGHMTYQFFYSIRGCLVVTALFYIFIGLLIWLTILAGFTIKRYITTKQCLLYVLITTTGILAAYLSLHFDVFGISGSYLD